jgi:predicted CXXCH cytochrome family protein
MSATGCRDTVPSNNDVPHSTYENTIRLQSRKRVSSFARGTRCSIIAFVTIAAARSQPSTYVNSKLCESCHVTQAQSYRHTGMARSFYRPQPGNTIEDYSRANSYYHEPSDSHFTMIERDGKYYQRRYQIGYQGKQTNIEEKQIHFVMGSGNHARTYLHRTSRNTLQQLPLGWYAEKGGHWGMSPGYDHPDHPDSRRTITHECMFCHNAYPQIPSANREYGADPLFEGALPEGVDCQRCHGPGGRHVTLAESGGPRENIRAAIVNPDRLSPERAMDVCAQCHLQTTTTALSHSILRYDRGPFSYRPGEPLSAFRLTFDHASRTEDRFEITSSVYRLRQSACFLKSAGRLRCTTCHDPHSIPRGEAATERYDGVCRQCHASAGEHTTSLGCVGCHMPKRRTDDVVHVVMTDHKIQRKKPDRDLIADMPERLDTIEHAAIVAYDPKLGRSQQDQLDLAVAQVRELGKINSGIPRLSKLIEQFHPQRADYYLELADGLQAGDEHDRALRFYEQASRRRPGSTIIGKKLAGTAMETHQLERAAAVLKRVVQVAPDDPSAWHLLGQAYIAQKRNADAAAALQKAIAIDPDLPEAHNNLGAILAERGEQVGAEREFREAMRVQPGLAQARRNLANLLALNHDLPQAAYYFESALRLKPDYATARLDYAQMLAETGDVKGATAHLKLAAQDSNPEIRRAALKLLNSLGPN